MIIEILIITVLCIFQSLFGVGLLLFGTPTFLLMGYDFTASLTLLLPISIIISFFQILNKKGLNTKSIHEFNIYCLPFLILFLILSTLNDLIDIRLVVSLLLIISSIISLNFSKIYKIKLFITKYRKICISIIGIIHGYSNMGGGFLSIFSSLINDNNKFNTRSYIAYGYLIMGIFQFLTIFLMNYDTFTMTKWKYLIVPIIVYYPIQIFFKRINNYFFNSVITYIALIYGMVMLVIILK